MVPLSFLRVFLLLLAISAFLAFGDGLVARLGLHGGLATWISGMLGALLVFGLAYQGGRCIAFCAKGVVSDPARTARLNTQAAMVGPPKDGSVPGMGSADIRFVVVPTSEKFIAFSVKCGLGHSIFLSTKMIDSLSDEALRGLLAHEYGHITNAHPIKQGVVLGMIAAVKMAFGVPAGALVLLLMSYLYMLRSWELAADAAAVKMSCGDSLLRALTEYSRIEGDDAGRFSEFFYGHPSFRRREAAIRQQQIGKVGAKPMPQSSKQGEER